VAAKKHHDAKQAEEAAAAEPTPAAEPAPAAQSAPAGGLSPDAMEKLKQLGELHDQGVLTDAEFEREKAKLL
jgi:hypothetical protein